jgi:hypothetical protein
MKIIIKYQWFYFFPEKIWALIKRVFWVGGSKRESKRASQAHVWVNSHQGYESTLTPVMPGGLKFIQITQNLPVKKIKLPGQFGGHTHSRSFFYESG